MPYHLLLVEAVEYMQGPQKRRAFGCQVLRFALIRRLLGAKKEQGWKFAVKKKKTAHGAVSWALRRSMGMVCNPWFACEALLIGNMI
jgi:hypothetical protein